MWLFLNLVILVAMIKLLITLERPFVCASIYVGASAFLGILFGMELMVLIARSVLTFVVIGGWFWVLNKIELVSFPWWMALAGGFAFAFVLIAF